MLIRRATIADLPQILRLVSLVVPMMNAAGNYQWDAAYPNEKVFKEDLALDQLWVAEADTVIAGISAITTDQDAGYADVGWDITEEAIVTHRLAVHPDFQDRGIGKALLDKAEEEAIRRNIRVLRVDTNTMNLTAQQLFPKVGYVFAGEIGLASRPGLSFYGYEKRLSQ